MKENYYNLKYDKGKLRWDLLELELIKPIVKVLTYGFKKYKKAESWKEVPDGQERYFSSLMRHLEAYRTGKKVNGESKIKHLWHAMCNIYFLIWFEKEGS